jgi:hypothetical protein
MRGSVALVVVSIALGWTGVAADGALTARTPPGRACGPYADPSTHWNVVFGHATSTAQAVVLRRGLLAKAFKGITFKKRYCDDIELEVSGVDAPKQRQALAKEADASGVPVSFEQPDRQKASRPGEVSADFGDLPTLARASKLQQAIAVKGWRVNDIVRIALHDWRVIVPHIPGTVRSQFAAEARTAGYRISFEP